MGISVTPSVSVATYVPVRMTILNSDPLSVGATGAIMYLVDNEDGTATLRIKAGTSATATDIAVNVGGGVAVP